MPEVADSESPPRLREIERWFVRRGVPHFVESRTAGSALDVWSRALPLLIAFYFIRSLNALRLEDWSWETSARHYLDLYTQAAAAPPAAVPVID